MSDVLRRLLITGVLLAGAVLATQAMIAGSNKGEVVVADGSGPPITRVDQP
jgi:hypothetical protein